MQKALTRVSKHPSKASEGMESQQAPSVPFVKFLLDILIACGIFP